MEAELRSKARHRTALLTTAGNCFVQEDRGEILRRIRSAPDGWFEATADPEGELVAVNACLVAVISRERTPLEQIEMDGPSITPCRSEDCDGS